MFARFKCTYFVVLLWLLMNICVCKRCVQVVMHLNATTLSQNMQIIFCRYSGRFMKLCTDILAAQIVSILYIMPNLASITFSHKQT